MSELSLKRWLSVIIFVSSLVGNAFATHFHLADSTTGVFLTVFLDTAAHPTLNGSAIQHNNIVPDEIGVFDSLGNCYGIGYWPAGPDSTFAVWGNNTTGGVTKPGMMLNATMHFRVWDTTLGEMPTTVTFYPAGTAVPFPPGISPSTGSTFVSGNGSYSVPKSITGLSVPAAPALSLPTNGATNQATALTISWASSSYASSYAIRVSTVSTFASTVSSQTGITAGTTAAVSGLANSKTFYWEVNATNTSGTSAWSSIWSFTTVAAVPAAPILSTPTNGATNQATSITVSWATSTGATTYAVQVSTISTFASTVSSQTGLTVTTASVAGLSYNATCYWRANAANTGGTSAWSSTWSFSTVPAVPVAPTLTSPTNGAGFAQGATVPLAWGSVSGATAYTVQVSTISSFASTVFNQSGAILSASFVNSAGGNHYWRVNAGNAGGTSLWSAVRSFVTVTSAVLPASAEAMQFSVVSYAHGALSYRLTSPAKVDISLFDILGKKALGFNFEQAAGSYRLPLNSAALPSGRYLLRFNAGELSRDLAITVTR